MNYGYNVHTELVNVCFKGYDLFLLVGMDRRGLGRVKPFRRYFMIVNNTFLIDRTN